MNHKYSCTKNIRIQIKTQGKSIKKSDYVSIRKTKGKYMFIINIAVITRNNNNNVIC